MRYQDDIDGKVHSADGSMHQPPNTNTFFTFESNTLCVLGIILDDILFTGGINTDNVPTAFKIQGILPATQAIYTENNLATYTDVAQAATAMLHGDSIGAWPPRAENAENADIDYPDETHICIPRKPFLSQSQQPQSNQPTSRHVFSYASSYDRLESSDVASTILRGRNIFITEKGYMGLMPDYAMAIQTQTEARVHVAVLATCSVPVLLVDHPDVPGAYRLLGTCFVQGWMDGEVLREEMGCEDPKEFWDAMSGSDMLRII
jgi:hypothetical protein